MIFLVKRTSDFVEAGRRFTECLNATDTSLHVVALCYTSAKKSKKTEKQSASPPEKREKDTFAHYSIHCVLGLAQQFLFFRCLHFCFPHPIFQLFKIVSELFCGFFLFCIFGTVANQRNAEEYSCSKSQSPLPFDSVTSSGLS